MNDISVKDQQRGRRERDAARRRRRLRPTVMALEGRELLSTLTVTNTNDSGTGSLRQAVLDANANPGSTIDFAPKLHGTITLTSGELKITSSVTIDGPGAKDISVSGNNASGVFEIAEIAAGFGVSISGLTITQGKAPDQGGGIQNGVIQNGVIKYGSNLTLTGDDITQNVVFESATDGGRGGGIWSLGGNLTITDCQITDNQALGAAGASAAGLAIGGGLYVLGGSATVSNSTFSGNLAQGGAGSSLGEAEAGAIFSVVPLVIRNSTFDSNQAVGGNGGDYNIATGGAISIRPDTSPGSGPVSLRITSSTFTGNSAVGGNGGTGLVGVPVPGVGGPVPGVVGLAEGGALFTQML
ncbi:MAG: hypothetical protein JO247_00460, partial [Chloroflexi bacterium]|nr:hypothetical protein [Chloroflexota bacterium]